MSIESKYDNSQVRRRERLLEVSDAVRLLREGEWGVLSLCSSGEPYGVPLNYVWNGDGSIYIHCAPEGRKLRSIGGGTRASFCVVGKTRLMPEKFTTAYESIIIRCSARTGLDARERMNALLLLVDKYSPEFRETGRTYSEKSFARTEIIRLDIIDWSGKTKKSVPRE